MQFIEPDLNSKRQRLAEKYASLMRRLSFVELAVTGLVLLVLVFGGVSAKLSQLLAFPQPWASTLYFLILVVGLGIILSWLTYYQGFVAPRRYGLSSQKLGAWLADRAKASALTILLGLVVVIVVYVLLDRLPAVWWLCTGILLFLLTLLLTRLTPTLLLPLFFKLRPLSDVEFKRRLTDLARRAHTQVVGVFTMDLSSKGTTANAMLAGLGKTRSIIVSDTLLQKYSPEEVEVVLAHELGHHLHRDVAKFVALQGAIYLLVFYLADLVLRAARVPFGFRSIADVTAFPWLFLSLGVFGLVATPFMNAYSRHVEAAADEAALELAANPQAFATAMAKLTDQNLSVANPSPWVKFLFYDHPPYIERVGLARRYARKVSQGGATSD